MDRTANTILDKPEKFRISFLGLKLRFGISPLKLGTLIYIGKVASKVEDVTDPEKVLSVIGNARTNALPMARVIAYAILNRRTSIILFGRLLAGFLIWRLTPKELITLLQLVIKQSHVTDFFACTVLVKGISPMIKTVQSKEDGPSGEKSQV